MSASHEHAKPTDAIGLRGTHWNAERQTWVSVYDGDAAGYDTDGGRWQVVCESHGSILSVGSLKLALQDSRRDPSEFCEDCRWSVAPDDTSRVWEAATKLAELTHEHVSAEDAAEVLAWVEDWVPDAFPEVTTDELAGMSADYLLIRANGLIDGGLAFVLADVRRVREDANRAKLEATKRTDDKTREAREHFFGCSRSEVWDGTNLSCQCFDDYADDGAADSDLAYRQRVASGRLGSCDLDMAIAYATHATHATSEARELVAARCVGAFLSAPSEQLTIAADGYRPDGLPDAELGYVPAITADGVCLTDAQRATASALWHAVEDANRAPASLKLAAYGSVGVLAVIALDIYGAPNPVVGIWSDGDCHEVTSADDFARWNAVLPSGAVVQRADDDAWVILRGGAYARHGSSNLSELLRASH